MAEIAKKGEPAGYARLGRRIETWRRTRPKPRAMPEDLWEAAARLAEKHGINPTAKALRLQYYALKDRVDGRRPRGRERAAAGRKPTFLEVPRLATPPSQNVLEIVREDGTKVTLRLSAAVDVVAVLESVWRTQR
jgi:hypothetical protein